MSVTPNVPPLAVRGEPLTERKEGTVNPTDMALVMEIAPALFPIVIPPFPAVSKPTDADPVNPLPISNDPFVFNIVKSFATNDRNVGVAEGPADDGPANTVFAA